MPYLEQKAPYDPLLFKEHHIGGMKVNLPGKLKYFLIPEGFRIWINGDRTVPRELPAEALRKNLLADVAKVDMTTRYPTLAWSEPDTFRIGTDHHHMTQFMHMFYLAHDNQMRVMPSVPGDIILLNNQIMEKGIPSVPIHPQQQVEFMVRQGSKHTMLFERHTSARV